MENCCIKISRHNNNYCSGAFRNVYEGDLSYLTLMADTSSEYSIVKSYRICLNHYNSHLKDKLNRCIAPSCNNGSNKSLIKCPVQFLIYFNLHESAIVNIHNQCYYKFKSELNQSTANSIDSLVIIIIIIANHC
jgi:hypothetical protein